MACRPPEVTAHSSPSLLYIEELPDGQEYPVAEQPSMTVLEPGNESTVRRPDGVEPFQARAAVASAVVETESLASSRERSESPPLTAYEVLDVDPGSTRHVIKKAFKRKVAAAKQAREEATTDESWDFAHQEVRLLEDVYRVLRDSELRAKYDKRMALSGNTAEGLREVLEVDSSLSIPSVLEADALTEPSALMAAGQSTLATIIEGEVLTEMDQQPLTGLPIHDPITPEPDSLIEKEECPASPVAIAAPPGSTRQSRPYSLARGDLYEDTMWKAPGRVNQYQQDYQPERISNSQMQLIPRPKISTTRATTSLGDLPGGTAVTPSENQAQRWSRSHDQRLTSEAQEQRVALAVAESPWRSQPVRVHNDVAYAERTPGLTYRGSQVDPNNAVALHRAGPQTSSASVPVKQHLVCRPRNHVALSPGSSSSASEHRMVPFPPVHNLVPVMANPNGIFNDPMRYAANVMGNGMTYSRTQTSVHVNTRTGVTSGWQQSERVYRDGTDDWHMQSDHRDFSTQGNVPPGLQQSNPAYRGGPETRQVKRIQE